MLVFLSLVRAGLKICPIVPTKYPAKGVASRQMTCGNVQMMSPCVVLPHLFSLLVCW